MVWFHGDGVEETLLQDLLLSSLYFLDSMLSSIVWIDKLHNCIEGICFSV